MSKFIEESVDFRLCAHINSAGGFIDNETFRLRREPFGNHDLLLIAAAQKTNPLLLNGRPDVQPLHKTLDEIALRFLMIDCARASLGSTAMETFVPTLAPSTRPVDFRSSGARAIPARIAS